MTCWRLGALVREGFCSVASSVVRSVLLVGVMAATASTVVALDLASSRAAIELDGLLKSPGINVVVRSGGVIDGSKCGLLGRQLGIKRSGGVFGESVTGVIPSGGQQFKFVYGTLGLVQIFANSDLAHVGPGWIVSTGAASELGLSTGSYVRVGGSARPGVVSAIVDVDARRPSNSRTISGVAPDRGDLTECWVEFEQLPGVGVHEAIRGYFESPEAGSSLPLIEIVPLLRGDETTQDPVGSFAERPSRDSWAVGIGIVSMVYLLSVWFRRGELALYRAVGTSRIELGIVGFVECSLLLSGAIAGAVGAGVYFSATGPLTADELTLAFADAGMLIAFSNALGSLSWMLVASLSVNRQLRAH